MKLTKTQFKILTDIMRGDRIALREGGYFNENCEHVNFNSIRGLIERGFLYVTVTNPISSTGFGGMVIDHRAVTTRGFLYVERYMDQEMTPYEREKLEPKLLLLHEWKADQKLTKDEIEKKAERLMELENALELHKVLYSAALVPTEMIIDELAEMISIVEEVMPYAKGDPEPLFKMLDKFIRVHREFEKYKEEESKDGKDGN